MVNKFEKPKQQKQQQLILPLQQLKLEGKKEIFDISPKWANRLLESKHLPFPLSFTWIKWLFEICSPSRCIVGEAYSYSSSYEKTCLDCCTIGNKFTIYLTRRSEHKVQENLQYFVKHWNGKHSNLTSKNLNFDSLTIRS